MVTPDERPAIEEYAAALEIALDVRDLGKSDLIDAIDQEIAAEAEEIRTFLAALARLDHALSVHEAIVTAMDHTDSPRHGWLRGELVRADNTQQEARRALSEVEDQAEDHLRRIKTLRRIRKDLLEKRSTQAPET